MADMNDRVREALGRELGGEAVLASTKGQLLGGTMKVAKQTGFLVGMGGLAGAAVSATIGRGADDIEKALRPGVVVAVTPRRVLVLSVTKVGANPKELVLAIDRGQIREVEEGTTRVALVKMRTFSLHLDGQDGGKPTVLGFEVPKVANQNAAAVVAALRA